MSHDDKTIVTLREIANVAGISVDAVRRRAKRRHRDGVWRILPSNHPQDPLRIEIPCSDLDALQSPPLPDTGRQGVDEEGRQPSGRPEGDGTEREGVAVETIVDVISTFANQVNSLTDRLLVSERERVEAQSDAMFAKAEISHLHEKIEAAMVSHRSELERFDKEIKQAKSSSDAEIESLRHTLAEMRARPWWRRLAG